MVIKTESEEREEIPNPLNSCAIRNVLNLCNIVYFMTGGPISYRLGVAAPSAEEEDDSPS